MFSGEELGVGEKSFRGLLLLQSCTIGLSLLLGHVWLWDWLRSVYGSLSLRPKGQRAALWPSQRTCVAFGLRLSPQTPTTPTQTPPTPFSLPFMARRRSAMLFPAKCARKGDCQAVGMLVGVCVRVGVLMSSVNVIDAERKAAGRKHKNPMFSRLCKISILTWFEMNFLRTLLHCNASLTTGWETETIRFYGEAESLQMRKKHLTFLNPTNPIVCLKILLMKCINFLKLCVLFNFIFIFNFSFNLDSDHLIVRTAREDNKRSHSRTLIALPTNNYFILHRRHCTRQFVGKAALVAAHSLKVKYADAHGRLYRQHVSERLILNVQFRFRMLSAFSLDHLLLSLWWWTYFCITLSSMQFRDGNLRKICCSDGKASRRP